MKVINNESWAGMDFSFAPGDEIDLPDDVAKSRIAAGLCRAMDFANVDATETELPTHRTKMAKATTTKVEKMHAKDHASAEVVKNATVKEDMAATDHVSAEVVKAPK